MSLAAQELISGCAPPTTTCAVKFQERFPLRTLGADFIYINKNQKNGGGGTTAHVVVAQGLHESGGA